MSKWTQFWDMKSGGGPKEDFTRCYIEAPEDVAKVIFYNRYGHNPERVTCTCCGEDYSISTYDSLREATMYQRGATLVDGKEVPDTHAIFKLDYTPLEDYIKREDVEVIYAKDIKAEEREGTVPEQGYVWKD